MKMRKLLCTAVGVALFAAAATNSAKAAQYVRVSPDLELYYQEAGTGTPLIFLTGWTGTSDFFTKHQIPHFSKKYRVLAYDPRSQGRSSKTLENNTFTQRGHDLRDFMKTLKLRDAIVVAWSWGCHDVYGYFRAYGTENMKAFVCIDQPPRSIPKQQGDWADYGEFSEVSGFINATAYDRRALMTEFFPSMMQRKMTPDEIAWGLDQVMKTPNYVATLLAADGSFADYAPEAKAINGKIPVLNVVSEAKGDSAKAWLKQNAPAAEIFVLGNHMMFYEYPEKFNERLDRFLSKLK